MNNMKLAFDISSPLSSGLAGQRLKQKATG
jgi:hypothetical protein